MESLRRLGVVAVLVLAACLLGALYGAIHDQLTYSLSPEYYSLLKFPQFRIPPAWHGRLGAAAVGVLATWWMGGFAGTVLVLVGLVHPDWRRHLKVAGISLLVALGIAAVYGFLGWLHALLVVEERVAAFAWSGRYAQVVDRHAFYLCGRVHLAGYQGGFVGLLGGIVLQVQAKRRGWFGGRTFVEDGSSPDGKA